MIDENDNDFVPVTIDGPRVLENCADQSAAYRLLNLMENLSEDHYAAGWLMGLEYELFDAAYAGDYSYGYGLTHEEVSQLLTLSQRCQGWWMWAEDNRGRKFVSLDEWLPFYEKRYRSA